MVTELNSQKFEETTKSGYAVIDFWAPWCGPCRVMAPTFEAVGDKLKESASFGKVNVDDNRELAMKYGIQSIPTILILKDGVEVERIMGAMDEASFTSKLQSVIK